MNEHENIEKNEMGSGCNCSKVDKWLRIFVCAFAIFLGTFLAVYFVTDSVIHRLYPPMPNFHHAKMIEKMMRENEREMHKFEKRMLRNEEHFLGDRESIPHEITALLPEENGYKLIICLKHFGNDFNNVKLDIKPQKVSIIGSNEKDNKNSFYSLSYSQTYKLDRKIDVKNVTKDVTKEKAFIYLPFIDNEND